MPKWTYPLSSADQPDSTIESSAVKLPASLVAFALPAVEAPLGWLLCGEDAGLLLFSRAAWKDEMAIPPIVSSPASIAQARTILNRRRLATCGLDSTEAAFGFCDCACILALAVCSPVSGRRSPLSGQGKPVSSSAISVADWNRALGSKEHARLMACSSFADAPLRASSSACS